MALFKKKNEGLSNELRQSDPFSFFYSNDCLRKRNDGLTEDNSKQTNKKKGSKEEKKCYFFF